MYSFFDEHDFSGKTIIPFDVHRDSRLSGTPDTIRELEPDATVISDGFTMKVLLVNGSPHREGCTYTALREVANTLNREGGRLSETENDCKNMR